MDFGISASDRRGLERTACVGTLEYMAPEQERRQRWTARADIYAFGLILYEMLARGHGAPRRPAAGTCRLLMKQRAVNGLCRRRYARTRGAVPRRVDAVVEQMPRGRSGGAVSECRLSSARRSAELDDAGEPDSNAFRISRRLVALVSLLVAAALVAVLRGRPQRRVPPARDRARAGVGVDRRLPERHE